MTRNRMTVAVALGLLGALAGCDAMSSGGGLPAGVAVADKKATIVVPAAESAIVADGQLVDKAWGAAVSVNEFVAGGNQAADPQSRVLVAYDADNLYIAVICDEPNTGQLKTAAAGRDGKVWSDDSVEVYVDPARARGQDFYGFFVNPKNVIYDRRAGRMESWSGQWASGASVIDGKAWIAELAIPFKTLGVTPKPGHKLGLMVARNRIAGAAKSAGSFVVDCRGEAKDTGRYLTLELR